MAVANLWAEPDQARPLDAPSLTNPVDIDAWLASMSIDDRLWLVDRLVTQALYGDQVTVVETAGDWTKVVVPRQPSSLDPRGYPGWLPTAQLTSTPPAPGDRRRPPPSSGPTEPLRDADRSRPHPDRAELQHPAPGAWPSDADVGHRGHPRGRPRTRSRVTDVEVVTADARRPPARTIVRTAEQFAGVAYLWGGTSAPGWDCSGLTSAVYAAHGVVIPRDADDQAAAGTPVDKDDLRPGDLLFYATGADRDVDPPRRHVRRRRQDDPGPRHRADGGDGPDRPTGPGQRVTGAPAGTSPSG